MVSIYHVAYDIASKLTSQADITSIVEYTSDGTPDLPCATVGVSEESTLTKESDGLYTLTATIRVVTNYYTASPYNFHDLSMYTQDIRTAMLAMVGSTLDGNLVAGVVPVSVSSTELLDTGGDTLMAQTSTYRIFIEQQD